MGKEQTTLIVHDGIEIEFTTESVPPAEYIPEQLKQQGIDINWEVIGQNTELRVNRYDEPDQYQDDLGPKKNGEKLATIEFIEKGIQPPLIKEPDESNPTANANFRNNDSSPHWTIPIDLKNLSMETGWEDLNNQSLILPTRILFHLSFNPHQTRPEILTPEQQALLQEINSLQQQISSNQELSSVQKRFDKKAKIKVLPLHIFD